MVGDGGKIGGPMIPPTIPQKTQEPAPKKEMASKPPDAYTQGNPYLVSRARSQRAAFDRDVTEASNLFELARSNPAGAKRLLQSVAAQVTAVLAEIEAARVTAQNLVQKLAKEQFAKEAMTTHAKRLKRERERLNRLKLRYQLSSRKMALLQQIAGKLGDPRLNEELDQILRRYRKLQTDWGRRHNALTVGAKLFGNDPDTPEHLHEVVKTEVRAGVRAQETRRAIENYSPHSAVSELIARSIDGTTRVVDRKDSPAWRGEYGKSAQKYAFLSEVLGDSLQRDPFKKS